MEASVNATQHFACPRYDLRVARRTCGAMYRQASAFKRKAGVVAMESPTAMRKCAGCDVGKLHASGRDADVRVVQLVPATDLTRKRRARACLCGEPVAPMRRWCSLACAASLTHGRMIAYDSRDLMSEIEVG